MKIRKITGKAEKIELQMTPMIDIVFQLLVFFIMTFKIVAVEGDFDIKMPRGATAPGTLEEFNPPYKLELTARADGNINTVTFQGQSMGQDLQAVTTKLDAMLGDTEAVREKRREDYEVELKFDENLRYEEVVRAISAVSGYKRADGHTEPLIKKIKFAAPIESGGG